MKHQMPPRYWNDLIPDYEPGCKRTVIDPVANGYLNALWKPNLHVYRMKKVQVVDKGVVLPDESIVNLDVLIYATGFSVATDGLTLNIGGRTDPLPKYWQDRGGPEAFMGILVPSFPNFVSLVGPNSITGHQSVIAFVESQCTYIEQLILGMFEKDIGTFEVREDVCRDYNQMLKGRLEQSAMNGSCVAWYKTKDGKNTTGWPGTLAEFWWRTRKVHWNDLVTSKPLH
ncbi:hypothetical protein BT69DRAFT_1355549 [Atractiella rhizophila]|nr:hypothetical protein BT69DRAFT_1355549 [Atractiella rhizophila]